MPVPEPYRTGLEPWHWRHMLAQAAVYHAARNRLAPLAELRERDLAVRSLLDQAQLQIGQFVGDDLDDGATIERVIKVWHAELDRILALPVLDEGVRSLLTDLHDLVRDACCDDPFGRLFGAVSSLSQALYGHDWRRTTLRIGHSKGHPRQTDDRYAVKAITTWGSPTEADVMLVVAPDQFCPEAYAVLPLVLVHECVCHVPARQQDQVKNHSTFAEGLLDWAAYFFFEQWATRLDVELAPAAITYAQDLSFLTRNGKNDLGQARRLGHHAANGLWSWFQSSQGMNPDESRVSVARLAVQLNLVDRSIEDKDHFVSRLGPPPPPDIAELLSRWVDGDLDAGDLLLSPENAA